MLSSLVRGRKIPAGGVVNSLCWRGLSKPYAFVRPTLYDRLTNQSTFGVIAHAHHEANSMFH